MTNRTKDTAQAQRDFVSALKRTMNYWLEVKLDPPGEGLDEAGCLRSDQSIDEQRLGGLVHSILCIFDGVSTDCPAQVAVMAIHGPEMLHDMFHAEERERNEKRWAALKKNEVSP